MGFWRNAGIQSICNPWCVNDNANLSKRIPKISSIIITLTLFLSKKKFENRKRVNTRWDLHVYQLFGSILFYVITRNCWRQQSKFHSTVTITPNWPRDERNQWPITIYGEINFLPISNLFSESIYSALGLSTAVTTLRLSIVLSRSTISITCQKRTKLSAVSWPVFEKYRRRCFKSMAKPEHTNCARHLM